MNDVILFLLIFIGILLVGLFSLIILSCIEYCKEDELY